MTNRKNLYIQIGRRKTKNKKQKKKQTIKNDMVGIKLCDDQNKRVWE